jgi:hypothetical protein
MLREDNDNLFGEANTNNHNLNHLKLRTGFKPKDPQNTGLSDLITY